MSDKQGPTLGISRPASEEEPLSWEAIDAGERRLEEFPWKDWTAEDVQDLVREIRYLQQWVINLECRVTRWRLFWERHQASGCGAAHVTETNDANSAEL